MDLCISCVPACSPCSSSKFQNLLYGRHWGLSRWSLHPPPIRDRAASDQGPGHRTATYGVVAARRPPMSLNVQPRTYRNLCCTGGTTPTCQPGTLRIVRMALLTEPVPRSVRQV